MGIITRIEDKLGNMVEKPFKGKNSLDLPGIDISLKRAIEKNRKNILGAIVLPHFIEIHMDMKEYDENEIFFEEFRSRLSRSITVWMNEKGYKMMKGVDIHFVKDRLEKKSFDIFVFFKKIENPKIVGWFIDEKTGERFGISQELALVGRGDDCTIRINHPTVSRRHASLEYQYGKIILEDYGSRMGIRVNHEKIHWKILNHGDKVLLGIAGFIFQKP